MSIQKLLRIIEGRDQIIPNPKEIFHLPLVCIAHILQDVHQAINSHLTGLAALAQLVKPSGT